VSLLNASTRNTPKCTRSLFELFRGYHRHSCESNRDASRKPKRDEQTNVLVAHAAHQFLAASLQASGNCRVQQVSCKDFTNVSIDRARSDLWDRLILGLESDESPCRPSTASLRVPRRVRPALRRSQAVR
jgi:hypothetical protein